MSYFDKVMKHAFESIEECRNNLVDANIAIKALNDHLKDQRRLAEIDHLNGVPYTKDMVDDEFSSEIL